MRTGKRVGFRERESSGVLCRCQQGNDQKSRVNKSFNLMVNIDEKL